VTGVQTCALPISGRRNTSTGSLVCITAQIDCQINKKYKSLCFIK